MSDDIDCHPVVLGEDPDCVFVGGMLDGAFHTCACRSLTVRVACHDVERTLVAVESLDM